MELKKISISIKKQYWYAFLASGAGLVLFMALFIKVCSVHTPSSNPNRPKAIPISQYSETLRRHMKRVNSNILHLKCCFLIFLNLYQN